MLLEVVNKDKNNFVLEDKTKYNQKEVFIVDEILTVEDCQKIISFFNENAPTEHCGRQYVEIFKGMELYYLPEKVESLINKVFPHIEIDWCHIVRWPVLSSQPTHTDIASNKTTYTSITYLNDTYKGGETYIEGVRTSDTTGIIFKENYVLPPKKLRTVCFDGVYFLHGVNTVTTDYRYTMSIWYKDRISVLT